MYENFINTNYIENVLNSVKNISDKEITKILDKAEAMQGLNHMEAAALISTEDPNQIKRIFEIAGKIKEHIYGDRVVMFAPLYVSDHCINNCRYCGFNCKNNFSRKKLTQEQIKQEVKILEKMGHKRIALEAGEDPQNCGIDYITECMKTIYGMKLDNGEIRRINVNIAATTIEDYKKLKETGIGTYILFQETYHLPTYEYYHISGPKSDFTYHLTAFDRAMEAGVDDVGAGVLFGLYDPKFEIIGLMLHNEHLEKKYGVGFHTISTPRICKAEGISETFEHAIDDEMFLRIVAVLRVAIPFTGMIISTRESAAMRKKLIRSGVSQLSAGSSVEVGGYAQGEISDSQFQLADSREASQIIGWLIDEELIPSFCTACYRNGRTGDRFMSLAKSGEIKNVCLPNALMTLFEYSMDYGNAEFQSKTKKMIEKKLSDIKDEKVRETVTKFINQIESGKRDLFL